VETPTKTFIPLVAWKQIAVRIVVDSHALRSVSRADVAEAQQTV
jgi:hypothetical protein